MRGNDKEWQEHRTAPSATSKYYRTDASFVATTDASQELKQRRGSKSYPKKQPERAPITSNCIKQECLKSQPVDDYFEYKYEPILPRLQLDLKWSNRQSTTSREVAGDVTQSADLERERRGVVECCRILKRRLSDWNKLAEDEPPKSGIFNDKITFDSLHSYNQLSMHEDSYLSKHVSSKRSVTKQATVLDKKPAKQAERKALVKLVTDPLRKSFIEVSKPPPLRIAKAKAGAEAKDTKSRKAVFELHSGGTAADIAEVCRDSAETGGEPARDVMDPAKTTGERARAVMDPAKNGGEPTRAVKDPKNTATKSERGVRDPAKTAGEPAGVPANPADAGVAENANREKHNSRVLREGQEANLPSEKSSGKVDTAASTLIGHNQPTYYAPGDKTNVKAAKFGDETGATTAQPGDVNKTKSSAVKVAWGKGTATDAPGPVADKWRGRRAGNLSRKLSLPFHNFHRTIKQIYGGDGTSRSGSPFSKTYTLGMQRPEAAPSCSLNSNELTDLSSRKREETTFKTGYDNASFVQEIQSSNPPDDCYQGLEDNPVSVDLSKSGNTIDQKRKTGDLPAADQNEIAAPCSFQPGFECQSNNKMHKGASDEIKRPVISENATARQEGGKEVIMTSQAMISREESPLTFDETAEHRTLQDWTSGALSTESSRPDTRADSENNGQLLATSGLEEAWTAYDGSESSLNDREGFLEGLSCDAAPKTPRNCSPLLKCGEYTTEYCRSGLFEDPSYDVESPPALNEVDDSAAQDKGGDVLSPGVSDNIAEFCDPENFFGCFEETHTESELAVPAAKAFQGETENRVEIIADDFLLEGQYSATNTLKTASVKKELEKSPAAGFSGETQPNAKKRNKRALKDREAPDSARNSREQSDRESRKSAKKRDRQELRDKKWNPLDDSAPVLQPTEEGPTPARESTSGSQGSDGSMASQAPARNKTATVRGVGGSSLLRTVFENSLETLHGLKGTGARKAAVPPAFEHGKTAESDSLPVRGEHKSPAGIACFQFDEDYHVKVLKKETNVGQKVHRERTERETKHGRPRLWVIGSPKGAREAKETAAAENSERPASQESAMSSTRPRRNSIIEFLQRRRMSIDKPKSKPKKTSASKKRFLPPIHLNRVEARDNKSAGNTASKARQGQLEARDNTSAGNTASKSRQAQLEAPTKKKQLHHKYEIPQQHQGSFEAPRSPPGALVQFDEPTGGEESAMQFKQRLKLNAHMRKSPIALQQTYNILERTPLQQKIEELRALRSIKRQPKAMVTVLNMAGNLIQDSERDSEEDISEEKTYRKSVPGITKLRLRALRQGAAPRARDPSRGHAVVAETERCKLTTSVQTGSEGTQQSTQYENDQHERHNPQQQGNNLPSMCDCNLSRPPTSLQRMRSQTPLYPSIIKELAGEGRHQESQVIQWSDKLGNLFAVKADNGRYGSISSRKDRAAASRVKTQEDAKRDACVSTQDKQENAAQNRKSLAEKAWECLGKTDQSTDTDQHHVTSHASTSANRRRRKVRRRTSRVNKDSNENNTVVVVFTSGDGKHVSFNC